jgi:hypothetical protein
MLEIRARRDEIFGRGINLYGISRAFGRIEGCIELPIIKEVEEGNMITPFASLDLTAAQILIDSLWDCGLRPSEGSGSAGALMATQEHLKNMKTVAFHLLKIDKKEGICGEN